jgi:hypothetical protein
LTAVAETGHRYDGRPTNGRVGERPFGPAATRRPRRPDDPGDLEPHVLAETAWAAAVTGLAWWAQSDEATPAAIVRQALCAARFDALDRNQGTDARRDTRG